MLACLPIGPVLTWISYNRYLAVAARAVRRSLKDGPRLQSERRGQMDLRYAKWEVCTYTEWIWCSWLEVSIGR